MKGLTKLPEGQAFLGAREVVRVLRRAGHEAFIVGGAVRDLVMGIEPKEYDIGTSAKPDEVRRLFRRTVLVGLQFGVVRVIWKGHAYEVATYRADLGYSDGRRPDAVRFTNLREDVIRRDFTMNGLALDPEDGTLIDLVGGLSDIEKGLIRSIGDPRQRFSEDALRIMRAIRFAAQLGFEIEEETWKALCEMAETVRRVSIERIRDETEKMLLSDRPGLGLRLLVESKVLEAVMPELLKTIEDLEGLSKTLDLCENNRLVRWASFLSPLGGDGALKFARRLRHSTANSKSIAEIVEIASKIEMLPFGDVALEKRLLRRPLVKEALSLVRARAKAFALDESPIRYAEERLNLWQEEDLFPKRLLNGDEVIALGIPKGPLVSKALEALEDAELRGQVRDREEAMRLIKDLRAQWLKGSLED